MAAGVVSPVVAQAVRSAEPLVELTGQAARAAEPVAAAVVSVVGPVSQAARAAEPVAALGTAPVVRSVEAVTKPVTPVLEPIARVVRSAEPITNAAAAVVGPVASIAGPVTSAVKPVGETAGAVAGTLLDPVTDVVQVVARPVTSTVGAVVKPVVRVVGPVLSPVTRTATKVLAPVTDVVQPVVNTVEPIVAPVTGTAGNGGESRPRPVPDVVEPPVLQGKFTPPSRKAVLPVPANVTTSEHSRLYDAEIQRPGQKAHRARPAHQPDRTSQAGRGPAKNPPAPMVPGAPVPSDLAGSGGSSIPPAFLTSHHGTRDLRPVARVSEDFVPLFRPCEPGTGPG
ncbi:hypothetical protein [Amycolatopsis sp. cmx-4-83]|uniref:hypothetical protein n=1 Tax=Amycolatopsis sp. cmx-4-83 TaxID=2790940 RepID=UPI00397A6B96